MTKRDKHVSVMGLRRRNVPRTSATDQIRKMFGQRLKNARVAAGYPSAQQFAFALGMEPHAYRKYERGHAEPSFETLIRMCDLLKVNVSALLPTTVDLTRDSPSHSKGIAA